MWFRSLFDSMKTRPSHKATHRKPRRPAASRLQIEGLEDRCLLSFLPAVPYAVDPYPNQVANGDFNGDGTLDLVTAHDSRVDVLLGNGDGTFGTAQAFPTGRNSYAVAVGDFNRDGKLDLATAHDGLVDVLLGNGDGTFGTAQSYQTDSFSLSVAVGDFNGDGKLDLVTANNWTSNLSVLLGNGDGTFGAAQSYPTEFPNCGVAVGDFNADGKLDLAAAGNFATDYDADGSVGVLLGNGDGTFGAAQSYGRGPLHMSVAIADLNADGKLDLVTGDWNTVSVLLGNGDGTFGAAQNDQYLDGSHASVAVGDFNGDNKLDVITANSESDGVSVLLGRGDGTLAAARNFGAGWRANSVTIGDFDADGKLDAAGSDLYLGTVNVLLNDGVWPPPDAPTLSISDATVTEGNVGTTSAVFTVGLSAPSGQTITVSYTTANGTASAGSDYAAGSGTLTFAPGETSQTMTLPVNGDRLGEADEYFLVNLNSPTNATIGVGQGVGTILDDEPRISVGNAMMAEGNSGTTPFNFTVSLSAAYDAPVTVQFATGSDTATAGSDYQAAAGTLTIPAGQATGTITVLVYGDRLAEPHEFFFVNLSQATSAIIANGHGWASIVNDEPYISISDVTKSEGKKGQTTLFTFTVTLSAAYDQAVTVSFRTVNGTAKTSDNDYIAKTGTLTFNPGETSKTITIVVNGDSKKEANETFYLDLFGNSSNSLFTKNRGIGTILNDD